MELKVRFTGRDALVRDVLAVVGPEGRRELMSVGAKALHALVRRHLRDAARTRHRSAARLGARPTGHLERGARAVTWRASASYGAVEVAIPGIARAFGDVVVRPVHAGGLTVPACAVSYGRRAAEVKALGWRLFRGRGKGERILFGRKGRETRVLYWLRDEVTLPTDRGLLPDDKAVSETVDLAFAREVMRVARKVCRLA